MTKEEIIAILENYKSFEDNRTEDLFHHGYDNTKASRKRKEALDEAIKALSENKGEWIEVVTGRFPNGEKRTWHYECSACSTGEPPCPINKEHWDFCPNCGADMRGGNE